MTGLGARQGQLRRRPINRLHRVIGIAAVGNGLLRRELPITPSPPRDLHRAKLIFRMSLDIFFLFKASPHHMFL